MKRLFIILSVALATASCSVYQRYARPDNISTDNLFGDGVATTDSVSIADISWREFFTDPRLQQLIERGLANNSDLRIASERVKDAEAALRVARLSYLPSFAFEPQITTRNLVSHYSSHSYSIPITASWDIDLAGRLWNNKRRAEAVYEQSRLKRLSIQSNLIASIANCYYTLLMLDEQLRISQSTSATWKKNVSTMRAMKAAGMTNEASVSHTEANSCSIEASLSDLQYKIVQVENSLSLLLGTTPQHIERGSLDEQHLCERLAVGIPAQLLSRRPDVQMAENALKQAFYNTNLARAAFYPSLTLSGSGGWTDYFGSVVSSPASVVFSFVGKLVTKIFDAGKLRANLKIAKSEQEQATIAFQQALLQAGSEVNDALAKCQSARSKTDIRRRQIASLESAVTSTQQLMKHSDATYLEVLTAQQALLSAQLTQIADRFDEIQGAIYLYQALGGGADTMTNEEGVTPAKKSKKSRRK